MNIDFPYITGHQNEEAIILVSDAPLYTLSSAVVGGGFIHTRHIINRHVDKNYSGNDPASDLKNFAHQRGITGDFVGLLTAVWMHHVRIVSYENVSVIITAGLGNISATGLSKPITYSAGTINIIVLIDGNLSPGAMVNAVQTVTEAKVAVIAAREIHTPEGYPATGTSTDAIVIGCTQRGEDIEYAGALMPVGYLIGKCVRTCLELAIDAN